MSTAKVKTFFRYFPVSDRDLKWGFHVTTAGEEKTPAHTTPYPIGNHPKGYDFTWEKGRVLHDFALVYIAGGCAVFESSSTPLQKVESGKVILLFPGVWHRYVPDQETGWLHYWVVFNGETPRRWVKNGFFTPKNPVVLVNREDLFLKTFTDILDAIRCDQPALQQVLASATGYLLSQLYSAKQANTSGQTPVVAAIREALRRMHEQTGAEIDVRTLAQELKVGYNWFRRVFLEHTGLSPHQYHLQLRIARARSLLSDTTLTIRQTAYETGFESEPYFCRLFKNKTGLTPSQWREQSRSLDKNDHLKS